MNPPSLEPGGLFLHFFAAGIQIPCRGPHVGVAGHVDHLGQAVPDVQSMGAEEMPELVRRDNIRMRLADPVPDAAVGFW
jgi:hypothetical protein